MHKKGRRNNIIATDFPFEHLKSKATVKSNLSY